MVHKASRSAPAMAEADIRRGILAWDGPWLGVSLTAMCPMGVSSVALASPAFVVPVGVTDYRLAFVTDEAPADEIAGTSSVIGTYNQFAATQAALNTNLPTAPTAPTAPTTAWRAIVSTSTMSAVNNISCGAACNANVPIFLVDGTEVATSTNNLFGGSAGILNVIDEDENAGAVAGAYVAGTNQLAFWYA
jgi:hypothetical protein